MTGARGPVLYVVVFGGRPAGDLPGFIPTLNEAIGLGLPIVAVPVPNTALAKHPAFQESVERLRSWGVRLLFDPDRYPLPTPNMGPPAARLFPWNALLAEVDTILEPK